MLYENNVRPNFSVYCGHSPAVFILYTLLLASMLMWISRVFSQRKISIFTVMNRRMLQLLKYLLDISRCFLRNINARCGSLVNYTLSYSIFVLIFFNLYRNSVRPKYSGYCGYSTPVFIDDGLNQNVNIQCG